MAAVACAATGALFLALAPALPATAADREVILDVLKVVDGEYVVETVAVPASGAEAKAAELAERPDVVTASVQVSYSIDATPDPRWEDDDPQAVSSVAGVWSRTRGTGQIVAVLDTSVDTSHPDLAGALVPGTDVTGLPADPAEWHGTAVAGVIAARADNGLGGAGMAPESRIMPVRVCTNSHCASAAVARGIIWAADHGADVINMSLAGPSYSDVGAAAIQYALGKNISVVASAGNEGLQGNPVEYPAANSGVIAVSATTVTGVPADWAVHGWQVDISTVGEYLLSTYPGAEYRQVSGTSFSGPAVAGAVALLRSGHPGISTEGVQAALQAGADSTATWDRAWGAGRLDMPAAFAAADRVGAAPGVTPSSTAVNVSWPAFPGAASYTVRVDGVARATVSGTSASIPGLLDGQQVAVDVQPSNGIRSTPVVATVGPAPPVAPALHSAAITGTATDATVTLSVSTTSPGTGTYSLIRDGVSLGTVSLVVDGTPSNYSFTIGAAPIHSTRWQLRAVDSLGRTSPPSNEVVAGTGMPAAPGAPTGLSGRADGGNVLLTWDDLGDAYTYRVSVAGETVGSPRTAGLALDAPVGESRTYAVAVVDRWGQAGPAASVSVTPSGATAPGAPGSLSGTAGNGSVTVSWVAAAANGSPVTRYTATAYPGGVTATTAGATTATITGLGNGSAYEVVVTATNSVGTGPASEPVTLSPAGAGVPGVPSSVVATRGDGRATVSWAPAPDNGSGVTGYRVTAFPGGATATTTGATSATVTGLTNGTAYTFTVTATNSVGTGPASARTFPPVTPAGLPGAPEAVTATAGDRTASVTWAAAAANGAEIVEYAVTASPGGETTYTDVGTSATVSGLDSGVAYTFTVRATNDVGTGPASVRSNSVVPTGAHPITVAHDQQGGAVGPLGAAAGALTCGLRNGGCLQHFQRGSIYWTVGTGARAVADDFRARWARLGWENGYFGYPVADEMCGLRNDGCVQLFEGGSIYWSPATGVRAVDGDIETRWGQAGWEDGHLGYPVADARCGLRDGGCLQVFEGGSIYWTPLTRARLVDGDIRAAWGRKGWELGYFGYPVADARCGLRGGGCLQLFQGGSIYWSPATGAQAVDGAIRDTWGQLGWELGHLGYPAAGAVVLPNGDAAQRFQGGSLYWSARTRQVTSF
ncbi:MAG: Peptidase and in kexin sedolisin [Blastococcus sp.]|nr:Peptidase and in kexin sedolisin [Blastococcus sp.]